MLRGADIYDSSCSDAARVIFIDKDDGYYLKSAPSGTLKTEAEMTRFFHKKGMAAEVLAYTPLEKDWLLTARARGEDCTFRGYLERPEKLCVTLAEILKMLHETDFIGCPVTDRMAGYTELADYNYRHGIYDNSLFPENRGFASADEAWRIACENRHLLRTDTLLHGDYCLPNVMLNDWKFSSFIDLGNGGVGDRHVDLFWGAWSLTYNLKTDKYTERFFDAYGRRDFEPDMLRVIAAFEVFG